MKKELAVRDKVRIKRKLPGVFAALDRQYGPMRDLVGETTDLWPENPICIPPAEFVLVNFFEELPDLHTGAGWVPEKETETYYWVYADCLELVEDTHQGGVEQ